MYGKEFQVIFVFWVNNASQSPVAAGKFRKAIERDKKSLREGVIAIFGDEKRWFFIRKTTKILQKGLPYFLA